MYRITNPAPIRKTSRKSTNPLSHSGNKLQYVNDITNEPTKSLSAIGSRNEPILLACDFQFLAI